MKIKMEKILRKVKGKYYEILHKERHENRRCVFGNNKYMVTISTEKYAELGTNHRLVKAKIDLYVPIKEDMKQCDNKQDCIKRKRVDKE